MLRLATVLCLAALGAAPVRAADSDFTVVGYRLQMRACRDDGCRPIHASVTPWRNRQACRERAELLQDAATRLPPQRLALGPGAWRIEARCAPVYDLRSA